MSIRNKTKILFVTYGGGHMQLTKIIAKGLLSEFDVKILALTTAHSPLNKIFGSKIVLSLTDFIHLFDDNCITILNYGNLFFKENFNETKEISKFETLLYFGLSFYDLAKEYGEEKALELYKIKGKNSFLPVNTMKKIINYIKPNILFTTNSPRMELASLKASKELNIPSVQIIDLFANGFPFPSADHIIVINNLVREKVQKILKNSISKIYSFGHPVFEETEKIVKKINREEIKKNIGISQSTKILLYAPPTANNVRNKSGQIIGIDYKTDIYLPVFDIFLNLKRKFNFKIILRPHPISDSIEKYNKYIEKNDSILYFEDNQLNLFESLAISDIVLVYDSTVGVQALFSDKITLTYQDNRDTPFIQTEMAKPPFIFCNGFKELERNIKYHLITKQNIIAHNLMPRNSLHKIKSLLHSI